MPLAPKLSPAPPPASRPSFLTRAADYLARSPQVFLLGLLAACFVEVAVDWNTTLYEINVARRALRQKGESYADVLRKAAQGPAIARDVVALGSLSEKLFDDPDVVYIRWSGPGGEVLRDALRPDYEAQRRALGQAPFRDTYRYVMERDTRGMLTDPAGLRERMARSRHRDLFQIFTDAQERLIMRVVPPDPDAAQAVPRVLYQDRLADSMKRLDRSLTYALGTILQGGERPSGVVLVAFRTERLGREITARLAKGLGVAVFFVGLILVQNIIGRRDKLRLRRLTEEIGQARAALLGPALGGAPPGGAAALSQSLPGAGELGLSFQQADTVEGATCELRALPGGGVELLVAVPQGSGLPAAIGAVALCEAYRRDGAWDRPPAERLAALLSDYGQSPYARPILLLLLQVRQGGEVRGASCGLPAPSVIALPGGQAAPLPLGDAIAGGEGAALYGGGAEALCPAPRPFAGAAAGAAVALYCDGRRAGEDGPLPQAEAVALLGAGLGAGRPAQALTEEVAALCRRRQGRRLAEDVIVFLLRPGADRA